MDIEDRRRYFIVGSVILEIVQPLFRTRLEKDYSNKGLGSLQAFLSTLPVLHILFHLRHRNAYCCKDNMNCRNNSKLPLIYCQWDLLYTENPGQLGHNCHCKFIANQVQLNYLDITLASLILLNCCHLGTSEENAVRKLRRYKNYYLSHNTEGKIDETEYKSLWTDLTNCVLHLDQNKQDDLIRIEKRPLDEGLCNRYSIDLLNIHKKLNEMDTQIQGIGSDVQDILSYQRNEAICQCCKNRLNDQGTDKKKVSPYLLGQEIFYLHHQFEMEDVLNSIVMRVTPEVVMMDDGRLVVSLFHQCRLIICNTDGSQVATIPVSAVSCNLTAVNNSTVALVVDHPSRKYQSMIELYDINNKHKPKSLPVHGIGYIDCLTMINGNLVIGVVDRLVLVDYQTGETVQNIETNCKPWRLHASGDKIFYSEEMKNMLHWYSFTDGKIHTLKLTSVPWSMTTLEDGSQYVYCFHGFVQHVSSNEKQFKTLKTIRSRVFSVGDWLQYNSKQKTMVAYSAVTGIVKILHAK